MGGKITNVLIGISNIFVGIVVLCFELFKIVKKFEFTKYQNEIMRIFQILIISYIIINTIINFIYIFFNKMEPKLQKSYALFALTLGYIIYPHFAFGIIGIIAGLILIINILRKNFVEADNNIVSSISIVLIIISSFFIFLIFFNDILANSLKEKDQIGLKKYDESFFKLVTPVENEDPKYRFKYINIKMGDKFGYINENGETLVDFNLDFATPFYLIEKNEQKYYIGGFTKGEVTEIVLKNGRSIMSYKSEHEIYDYGARIDEFEKIVKETINPRIMQLEIPKLDNYYVYSLAYKEDSREERLKKNPDNSENVWTYRYDFSDEFDVLITESVMGYTNKYELAYKDNLDKRIKLKAEYLIYDSEKLYTLPGGYIPFFNPKEKVSGYFNEKGERKKLSGTGKILYIEEDRVLIKNETKKTSYFIDSATGKEVSPSFKEIIVDELNNRYLVKDNNNKWMLLNKNLQRVFQDEFDIVKTDLLKAGIYIFANFPENLEVNEYNYIKIDYRFANSKMDTIAKDVNFFYNSFDKINKTNITPNDYEAIKEDLAGIEKNEILDKYYNLIHNKEKTKENILSEIEKEKKIQGPDGNKDMRDEKLEKMKEEQKAKEKQEQEENKTPVASENTNSEAPSLPDLE